MEESKGSERGWKRVLRFIVVLQTVFFTAHLLVYETWISSQGITDAKEVFWYRLILSFLSISFVSASLLAFRYTNRAVRAFYRVAAIWAGFLSFFFFAAILSWVFWAAARLVNFPLDVRRTVQWLFGAAFLAALYAVLNAHWTRVTRRRVQLENLPASWRGRTAVLISDLHLGPLRSSGFLQRMVSRILREKPDAVFIGGDLYDGTAIDIPTSAKPLARLVAAQGVYFVAGNHEQFGDDSKYLRAIAGNGVRVLNDEKVEVDGLQIVGVSYRSAARGDHLASLLRAMHLDRTRASILLAHAPYHPAIAEQAGISLQLSGHTHLGQFIPWSWIARRVYRQFVYGLSRLGKLQVVTSSGAGSWGPPLRLGSISEIVVLQFE
jgi:uncharacterized protein